MFPYRMQALKCLGSLVSVFIAALKAAPHPWGRGVLIVLLVLGVAALSLCSTGVVSSGNGVSTAVVSSQNVEETTSSVYAHKAYEHGGHCDETGSLAADQRTGSLSASALLGMGVFAFVGLPVPGPALRALPRSARRCRTLPLGGTRALLALCVRRV